LKTKGKLSPIRPYRQRVPGTVKFAGLRLSQRCVDALVAYGSKRKLSNGAAIADALETWARYRRR